MNQKYSIPYVNFGLQWKFEKENLLPIIEKIFTKGQFVGGDEIQILEKKILRFTNSKYATTLNSGTDALTIGLHLLGIGAGDEVITVPNSFIASTAVIVHLGAKPIFVDVMDDQNINYKMIEEKITKKTKAIMPVHLTGRVCRMDKILNIANKYKINIIEDAAQAIGSKFNKKYAGSFGKIGCISTHPLKNLNASGDGGILLTNDKRIYKNAKMLSNHGLENRDTVKKFGYVSRMDNLQAAILNFRLNNLKDIIKKRRENANLYFNNINNRKINLPYENSKEFNTYHTFVIQAEGRDKLKNYLAKNGVETAIHYPKPIHLQPAAKKLGYKKNDFKFTENQSKKILSIPINQFLKKNEIIKISKLINRF